MSDILIAEKGKIKQMFNFSIKPIFEKEKPKKPSPPSKPKIEGEEVVIFDSLLSSDIDFGEGDMGPLLDFISTVPDNQSRLMSFPEMLQIVNVNLKPEDVTVKFENDKYKDDTHISFSFKLNLDNDQLADTIKSYTEEYQAYVIEEKQYKKDLAIWEKEYSEWKIKVLEEELEKLKKELQNE